MYLRHTLDITRHLAQCSADECRISVVVSPPDHAGCVDKGYVLLTHAVPSLRVHHKVQHQQPINGVHGQCCQKVRGCDNVDDTILSLKSHVCPGARVAIT